jgi:NAD(P)-dependent dehydrogenase (short-subunit alcohol dehydrogenase family)
MAGASRGRIVVTGASTGIGRACSIRFADLGYAVLAGVRSIADGDAIRTSSPERIQPVLLDVTRPESIASASAAVGGEPLAGLVNNAGIAVTGPLEIVSIEAWRRQFEVNVIGLVAVTQAFLPLLRPQRGRIVNVGSIAGRSALPGSGAYDASKFAVEAITDALRMEVSPWGISVSVIEAGAVATSIWKKTLGEVDELGRHVPQETFRLYAGLMATVRQEAAEAARKAISVDAVVKAVEHAMTARHPKTRYPVGADAWFWLLLNLLPDRWRDRLILSRIQK